MGHFKEKYSRAMAKSYRKLLYKYIALPKDVTYVEIGELVTVVDTCFSADKANKIRSLIDANKYNVLKQYQEWDNLKDAIVWYVVHCSNGNSYIVELLSPVEFYKDAVIVKHWPVDEVHRMSLDGCVTSWINIRV